MPALAPDWLDPDVGALDLRIWPAGAHRVDGVLEVGGVAATDLADRFGTPLLVLDEAAVRDRADRIRAAFESAALARGTRATVYYAGKAFLAAEVVRWVRGAGLRVEVCSGGELALALAAGAEGADLALHGNNPSRAEVEAAVAARAGSIVLDWAGEVGIVADAAARAGVVQPVRIRVNSGVHASTHEYLATASEDQKFGVALADVPAVAAAVRARPELRLLGLHSHIGSQIFDAGGFAEAARRLVAVHAAIGGPPELNLGGGFGIAYTAADAPEPIEAIAGGILDAVAAACAEHRVAVPVLAVESGRWIVGPAGVTLYTAGAVKDLALEAGARRYVSVDGGMSDNARPALYGAEYTVALANRAPAGPGVLVRVVGKHCESGDVVVRHGVLPADAGAGDLLAVAATGAYCHSLASNYNLVPRPPVVAVRDGAARLLVRGESVADLLARDAGLAAVPA